MTTSCRRRGSVLIVVLFVSAVLSLMAMSLTYRSGLVLRASRHRAIMVKLQSHADSAAVIAIMRISENTADFDHLAQSWHTHGPLADEGWMDDWLAGTGGEEAEFAADFRVSDEEGKLNILMASSESLRRLGMTEDQIACLFDYMDADEYSRPGGAESSYYQSRALPRRSKNGPIEVLDELMSIKGFGPRDYWGSYGHYGDELEGWVDTLTSMGSGQININTAPLAVLETIGISENGARQIIAFRRFDAFSSGCLENHAFRSFEDVEQLQGLSLADRQMLVGRIVFQSRHFRVLVTARHKHTCLQYDMDLLVRRDGQQVDILQHRRASW